MSNATELFDKCTECVSENCPLRGMVMVRFAHDMVPCKDCGEPWCEKCEDHYGDCKCPGPHSEGVVEIEGVLWAPKVGE